MDREIAVSYQMRGQLDDDYTLFESGRVLHEFDRNMYPSGTNLKEELRADQLRPEIKQRLLDATPASDKELAKKLLNID